jgi:hypothetical protein
VVQTLQQKACDLITAETRLRKQVSSSREARMTEADAFPILALGPKATR